MWSSNDVTVGTGTCNARELILATSVVHTTDLGRTDRASLRKEQLILEKTFISSFMAVHDRSSLHKILEHRCGASEDGRHPREEGAVATRVALRLPHDLTYY